MTTKKTNLKVVEPDLEQMERELIEAAEHMVPMINADDIARAQLEANAQRYQAQLIEADAGCELVQALYENYMIAANARRERIKRAIAMNSAGLTQDVLSAAE